MDTDWLLCIGKLIMSTLFVYWSAFFESIRIMVSVNYIWYVTLRICSVVSVNLSVCGMNGENIRI